MAGDMDMAQAGAMQTVDGAVGTAPFNIEEVAAIVAGPAHKPGNHCAEVRALLVAAEVGLEQVRGRTPDTLQVENVLEATVARDVKQAKAPKAPAAAGPRTPAPSYGKH